MNNFLILTYRDARKGFIVEVTLTKEYADRLLMARDALLRMTYAPEQMLYGGEHPVRVFFEDIEHTRRTGRAYGKWDVREAKMSEDHETKGVSGILHVAQSGAYWSVVTDNGSEIETLFLDWQAPMDAAHTPTSRYEVSIPDMYHPGKFKTSAPFEHRKDAIEFARQWGADENGSINLINELKS